MLGAFRGFKIDEIGGVQRAGCSMPFVVVYKQPSAGDTGFVRHGDNVGGRDVDGVLGGGWDDQYMRG